MNRTINIGILGEDGLALKELQAVLTKAADWVATIHMGARGGRGVWRAGRAPDVMIIELDEGTEGQLEIVRRVRSESSALKIIVISTRAGKDWIHRVLLAGATGYILRPFSEWECRAAIELVLSGGCSISMGALRSLVAGPGTLKIDASRGQTTGLTGREASIMGWIRDGLADKEVAEVLGISEETIGWHLKHIYRKLRVNNRTAAVASWLVLEEKNRDRGRESSACQGIPEEWRRAAAFGGSGDSGRVLR